jgi:superfamily I DNA/RNA helicase
VGKAFMSVYGRDTSRLLPGPKEETDFMPTKRAAPAPKDAPPPFRANPQQAAAIAHTDGPAAFIAAAGTGKTAILVQRLVRLIAEVGVAPEQILCVTFTRAAAEEMKKRAMSALRARGKLVKDLKGLHVVTFHGLGHQMLREKLGWTPQELNKALISGDPRQWLAEDILRPWRSNRTRGMNWDVRVADVLAAVDRAKEAQIPVETASDYFQRDLLLEREVAARYQEFFSIYESTKKKQKLYDLADLIYIPLNLLEGSPTYRKTWQGRFRYLQVDETQDTNPSQYQLIRHLAAPQDNVVVVGDPDQCQPSGTMVRLANGTDCPIEQVEVGAKVITYGRREATFVKNGIVTEISHREYDGPLYTILVDGKQTDCTYNHKWLVRWAGEHRNARISYLMRQGNRYCIGQTTFFLQQSESSGAYLFGLASRGRQARADAAWILKVHENLGDALIYEEMLAAKYGLPENCFHETDGIMHFTQEMIDSVFYAFDLFEQEKRALQCLADHDRSVEYPMWSKRYEDLNQAKTYQGRSPVFETQACNLISDYMAVILAPDSGNNDDRGPHWKSITVTKKPFSGMVYSLNVTTHHNYIANGILTCNSIYGFRGSSPEASILAFKKMYPRGIIYPIEENYRSTPQILDAANRLIAQNETMAGFEKQLRPTMPDGPPVMVTAYENQEHEAEGVAARISDVVRSSPPHAQVTYRDIFVLSRTNHHLASLELVLARNHIPYRAVGGSSLFKRKTTRDMLAFLALADGMRLQREYEAGHGTPTWDDLFTPILCGEQNEAFRTVAHIPSLAFFAQTGKTAHRFPATIFGTLASFGAGRPLLQTCAEQTYRIPTEYQLGIKDSIALITAIWERSHNRPDAAMRAVRELAYDAYLRQRDTRHQEDDAASDDDDNARETARQSDEARVESRYDELDELIQIASHHHTIRHFLQAMALLKEQAEDTRKNQRDCVSLLTVHKSKGLERPVVFVMGLIEGIFPHKRSFTVAAEDGPVVLSGIPEERRLAYVAFTRAQRQLFLSCILRYRASDAIPARFIAEAGLEPRDEAGLENPYTERLKKFAPLFPAE